MIRIRVLAGFVSVTSIDAERAHVSAKPERNSCIRKMFITYLLHALCLKHLSWCAFIKTDSSVKHGSLKLVFQCAVDSDLASAVGVETSNYKRNLVCIIKNVFICTLSSLSEVYEIGGILT